jgi:hypothetical protein
MLADQTVGLLDQIDYRDEVSIAMVQRELTLAIRRPDDDRLAWAAKTMTQSAAEYPHRWSLTYAQESQHLAKYPAEKTIVLQAIQIGDIGIAAAPCEVFAETGLAIKSESPQSHTFTIELANGYGGYLPTREQHQLGGYETWPARSSHLEIEAESKIRDELLRMLSQLKGIIVD